jgi:hypothetical protein
VWDGTAVEVPREWAGARYRDALSGGEVAAVAEGDVTLIPLADAFGRLPMALLEHVA